MPFRLHSLAFFFFFTNKSHPSKQESHTLDGLAATFLPFFPPFFSFSSFFSISSSFSSSEASCVWEKRVNQRSYRKDQSTTHQSDIVLVNQTGMYRKGLVSMKSEALPSCSNNEKNCKVRERLKKGRKNIVNKNIKKQSHVPTFIILGLALSFFLPLVTFSTSWITYIHVQKQIHVLMNVETYVLPFCITNNVTACNLDDWNDNNQPCTIQILN